MAGRYWLEIGQHHAGEGAANTRRQLARLIEFFGKDKLITEITGDDIARLVAWRRGHRSRGSLISPFTVNDTTEQVKKLFTRAKVWGVKFLREPRWRDHWLVEPQERVNELKGDQGERLEAAARDEYAPILALAEATACGNANACCAGARSTGTARESQEREGRQDRCGADHVGGSRDPLAVAGPTSRVRVHLCRRARPRRAVKGERHPITQSGLKTQWRRLRKRAGVTGFRFHDYRHDFGTKLLRQTGNFKLVSRALIHADLKSTARYAHVVDEDIRVALEQKADEKSRTKSRNGSGSSLKRFATRGE